jgi:hypothetical protein
MATERECDADRLDHALFMAVEEMSAFMKKYPGALNPRNLISGREKAGDAKAGEAATAISSLRHLYVRPLMDPKQREATNG